MTNGNGNGKRSRSSGSTTIVGFGKVVVDVRLYPTAKDRDDRGSFSQYHDGDMGKVRYKMVCEICGDECRRGHNIVKGKSVGDTVIPFSDAELASIRMSKSKNIQLEYFIDAKKFTPAMLGKSWYVGTGKDGGAQPFKFLHEVMKERPGHVAKLRWVNSSSHDVHGVMSVHEEGFIVQEIAPEYLYKPFSTVEVKDADVPARLIEKGMGILKDMIREEFDHATVVDEYPEAVDKLTGMKAMGEEIPVEELPQKKAEIADLEAMLE